MYRKRRNRVRTYRTCADPVTTRVVIVAVPAGAAAPCTTIGRVFSVVVAPEHMSYYGDALSRKIL